MSTLLRMFRASTPVESFWEVVRIVALGDFLQEHVPG